MDWRDMTDSAERRAAKAEHFREFLHGSVVPSRPSSGKSTGRMVISAPRLRSIPREDGKPDLSDLVDAMWEKGLI